MQHPRPDIASTRERLLAGASTCASEMETSIHIAQAPSCRNVFLAPDFEPARQASRKGDFASTRLGGLAVSVKDLFDVAGEVSAAGSKVLADTPPALADSPAVARLRAAGGVLLGRTNMTEFAFSGVGVNPHHGTPVNPADETTPRIPGGSSSGAAVSVATGAAFIGLGSDTGGSIRVPAALCGIVGFKNTARLTSTHGAVPLSTTLDTACAMTRSVRDAILAHEVLSGTAVSRADKPLAGYRFAVAGTTMLDALDATVAGAFDRTLRVMRDAGATVEEVALGEIRDLAAIQAAGGLTGAEAYSWHRELLAAKGDGYDARVRMRIDRGGSMKAYEYVALVAARREAISRMETALHGFDAVLSPTVPLVAPPIESVRPPAHEGERQALDEEFFRVNNLLLRNTSLVNMLDGCAISIPCHALDELPVGLMMWHGAMHDGDVLKAALQAESALAQARPA